MNRQTFTWDRSSNKLHREEQWTELFYIFSLLLAALILLALNLGNLPLRDADEGLVAQVAKEIWQAPPHSLRGLFPTYWGEPYLNKPPLVHNLMAMAYSLGGLNEWMARLPGAVLTACSVPLLYLVSREIFPARMSALFSALTYLTLLPVIRHGRLAMLDGGVLCFELLMILCVLRSRRDLRWSLGAGLGFSLICLTKGILGVLLAGIILIFVAWDTPRLLTSAYFWFGWILGTTPALAWYGAQWLHYEHQFTDSLFAQQLNRTTKSIDHHQGQIWYYVLEIIKYAWPWLLFIVYGLRLAYQERIYSWAKLVLVWGGIYLIIVSLMATKLPWYIIPIYPALAVASGAALTEIYNLPSDRPYPRIWIVILGFLAFITGFAALSLYFNLDFGLLEQPHSYLILIFAALSLTMGVAAILMSQRSREFMPILFWGMYVCLILFVSSSYWNWELNEAYPVKPVAQMIHQQNIPSKFTIYTSNDNDRPSLNFYSDRRIRPISQYPINEVYQPGAEPATESERFKQFWQENPHPYLLLKDKTLSELKLPSVKILSKAAPNWVLVTK